MRTSLTSVHDEYVTFGGELRYPCRSMVLHVSQALQPVQKASTSRAWELLDVGLTMFAIGMSAKARRVCRKYISNSSQMAA